MITPGAGLLIKDVSSAPLPKIPARGVEQHKGDFGRVFLVGGAPGMSGAISLAGIAALRTGAGLVRVGTPASCQTMVASHEPCYMTVGLPADSQGLLAESAFEAIAEQVGWADSIAVGPGIGRSLGVDRAVQRLFAQADRPAIFDADALGALGARPIVLDRPGGPRVLTPHPGELRKLLDLPTDADRVAQCRAAIERAKTSNITIVLKGHRTFITDGVRGAFNSTGNPGMATGGSGDVLTGVIAVLLGQGFGAFDAARLGVHLHGRAGDLAVTGYGPIGMIASDIARYLPAAIEMQL